MHFLDCRSLETTMGNLLNYRTNNDHQPKTVSIGLVTRNTAPGKGLKVILLFRLQGDFNAGHSFENNFWRYSQSHEGFETVLVQIDSDPKRQSIAKNLMDNIRQNLAVACTGYVFVSITSICFMTACGASYQFTIVQAFGQAC